MYQLLERLADPQKHIFEIIYSRLARLRSCLGSISIGISNPIQCIQLRKNVQRSSEELLYNIT